MVLAEWQRSSSALCALGLCVIWLFWVWIVVHAEESEGKFYKFKIRIPYPVSALSLTHHLYISYKFADVVSHCRCSAGIAHCKTLAKLCCGLHKPNKQTVLPQAAVAILYATLPVTKVNRQTKISSLFSPVLISFPFNCAPELELAVRTAKLGYARVEFMIVLGRWCISFCTNIGYVTRIEVEHLKIFVLF